MSIEEYHKMDLEDVLRILEEDYTIVETTVDYVGIELNDREKITIPLDLWTQAIMLHTTPLYEQEMRVRARMVGE